MYYAEKLILGELYYINTPKTPWIKFTAMMLSERIVELEKRLLEEFNYNLKTHKD
jgi:hypothetical protein